MASLVYSPALTLLFVWMLLWIMMDIHFRDLTSAQKWLVPLLILLLAALNHVLQVRIGHHWYKRMLFLTMHLPFFLAFLYVTRRGIIKMAFMILTALVFTAPTVLAASFVGHFFPGSAHTLLISDLLSYSLMLLLTQLVFRRSFNYLLRYGDNALFLRLSFVPFLYYIYVFAVMNVDLTLYTSPSGILVRLIPRCC